jgi:hypothetical protein
MGCGNTKSKNNNEIYESNIIKNNNNNKSEQNIDIKDTKKNNNILDESIDLKKNENFSAKSNKESKFNNNEVIKNILNNSSSNISNEEININEDNNNNENNNNENNNNENNNDENNTDEQYNINENSENETTFKNSPSYNSNISESLITINSSIQNNNNDNLTNKIDNFSIIKENKYFSIILKPYIYDTVLPIWCEKNTDIIFRVYGKWNIDDYNECDSKGIESENINENKNEFNNGALLGRILDSSYFLIYDNLHYVSYTKGPLYFKMNVNNYFDKINPKGELNLKIYGVKNLSYEEIDELLGWEKNIKEIIYTNQSLYSNISIPILEKETIILVNKMRVNSSLFAKEYLENIKNLTSSTGNLYNFMIKENIIKYEKLKVNPFILNKIQEFYLPILGKNNKSRNKNYNILTSEIELENYLKNVFGKLKRIKLIIKKHNSFKPLTLAIRFLLDENIRNEIFTSKNSEISILTLKSKKYNNITLYSIIVFSEDKLENSLYFANILDSVKEKTTEQNNNNNNNNNSAIANVNSDNLETIKEEIDSNKTIKKVLSEKMNKSDLLANRIILDENMDPDILNNSSFLSGIKIGNLQDY